ncbi:MAG: hypothetical protein KGS61_15465 [Verrucomicrobia bacterium]|nr:hypothetical protein [Verrucomicrobiota bacterium]
MQRLTRTFLLALMVAGGAHQAAAFSLLGNLATWQTAALNYGWHITGTQNNIGGPQNIAEGYRWNQPTIYYAVDESFLKYFGQTGAAEIDKAVAVLNNLPPASQINLNNYGLKTERINYQAQALGLLDLKTSALQSLVQELGMGDPEQALFVLRTRWTTQFSTNYYVINRNFDPSTFQSSAYINGDLWTFITILDNQIVPISAAIIQRVDPLAYGDPVTADGNSGVSSINLVPRVGKFFLGFTRDDAASYRYLYNPLNLAVENAPTNSFIPALGTTLNLPVSGVGGFSGSPWLPVGATSGATGTNWVPIVISTNAAAGLTNAAGTVSNLVVDVALRPGRDHIRFQKIQYDSLLGVTIDPFVDQFTDVYLTNGVLQSQNVLRIVTQPDIVFTAADLFSDGQDWLMMSRTTGWLNEAANNRSINPNAFAADTGPGLVSPPVVIAFNWNTPAYWGVFLGPGAAFLSQDTVSIFPIWGSFDGSTNAPVIYPSSLTFEQLEQRALRGP